MAIDIESYLTEIDAENFCGEDLEYDAEFIALEQEVQGKEEQTMGDSVIEAEPPNWKEVIKRSETLLKRTRDIRILVYYLKALTLTQGLTGFSEGIQLLQKILEKRWDTIHPQLDPDDDNDPTERINILMSLCDFETFIKPLQEIYLVESKALGRFNLRDIQIADGTIPQPESISEDELPLLSTIEGAFTECEADELIITAQAGQDILQSLNQMETFVTEQVGINDAASFTELRVVIKDMNTILGEQVDKRGLNESETDAESGEDLDESVAGSVKTVKPAGGPPGINSHQDVIKAINLISEYYKKNEPSSPIPILLERVLRLVGKDFLEVMQDIAPNGVEQVEFLRGSSNNQE